MFVLYGIMVDIAGFLVNAFAGCVCWNWYIPVAFPGAPALTFTNAVGIVFVSSIFCGGGKYTAADLEDPKKAFTGFPKVFIATRWPTPLTVLAFAWVAHTLLF